LVIEAFGVEQSLVAADAPQVVGEAFVEFVDAIDGQRRRMDCG